MKKLIIYLLCFLVYNQDLFAKDERIKINDTSEYNYNSWKIKNKSYLQTMFGDSLFIGKLTWYQWDGIPTMFATAFINDSTFEFGVDEGICVGYIIPPPNIIKKDCLNIEKPKKEVKEDLQPEIITIIERRAQSPGGEQGLRKFFHDNLIIPKKVIRRKYFKTAFYNIVISEDGSVDNVQSLNKLKYGLNREAERVIKLMPKWKPAAINGKSVKMIYKLEVHFEPEPISFPNLSW